MTICEIRESVQDRYRAKLRAQINALYARLEEISGPASRSAWLTRIKLKAKIQRLERDLAAPLFVEMEGR